MVVILKCIAGPHIGQRFRLESSVRIYLFTLLWFLTVCRVMATASKWGAPRANCSRKRESAYTKTRRSPQLMRRYVVLF